MGDLTVKHNELSADEFIFMWESVWGQGPSYEQTLLAMKNTLFRVSIFDGEQIVAMARVIFLCNSVLCRTKSHSMRNLVSLLMKLKD